MKLQNFTTPEQEESTPKTTRCPMAHRARGLWTIALFASILFLFYAVTVGRGYKSKILHHLAFKPAHSQPRVTACESAARAAQNALRPAAVPINGQFEHVELPNAAGISFTSVGIGPDHRLYAGADDGRIFRYPIRADGTLGPAQKILSLQTANGGHRLLTGFCFDPAATADNPILWAAHGYYAFTSAPDWSGKITRLSGSDLQIVEDVVIHLPRSYRDHLTNQPAFGPDGALYFPQGSNSAKGAPDEKWGNRDEHLLTATILRLDVTRVTPGDPLDAQTDAGDGREGCYDPAAPDAPLTIYASGIRNAFDLVWASNGRLYVPNNGSCIGGNTPAGPGIPALNDVALDENDWLFSITPGKYYGHPNPAQHHYILNGGHPDNRSNSSIVPQYPTGTLPDDNWEAPAFDFGVHASANGIIEYLGDAFGGRLKHTLLVCRYNVGSDIVILSYDHSGKVSALDAGIGGLDGFVNPLDLTEDQSTGNLYVAEYGGRRITLLRPVGSNPPTQTTGAVP